MLNIGNKRLTLSIILFVLVMLEILSMADLLIKYDRVTVSLCAFAISLSIGIVVMLKAPTPISPSRPTPTWILALGCVILTWVTIHNAQILLRKVPVDYHLADMLPIMQIMSKRFLDGQQVYAIIPEIWGDMQPIYLPAMWMPYIPSVMFNFDPRWITVFFTLLAVAVPLLILPKKHKNTWWSLLLIPALAVLFRQFLKLDVQYITLCDEGVVVGWYVLLGWALWKGNPYLIGTFIAISVLSRLSVVGFIPAYMIWLFFFQSRDKAIRVAITGGSVGLVLMVVSQAIFHIKVFTDLPGRYLEAIMGTEFQKLQGAIQEGLGIAKMLPQSAFPALAMADKVLAFAVPLLLVGIYARFRSHFDSRWFPIGMLKIGLVVFFNLLIIPIITLFYASTFLSVAMLAFYLQDDGNHNSTAEI